MHSWQDLHHSIHEKLNSGKHSMKCTRRDRTGSTGQFSVQARCPHRTCLLCRRTTRLVFVVPGSDDTTVPGCRPGSTNRAGRRPMEAGEERAATSAVIRLARWGSRRVGVGCLSAQPPSPLRCKACIPPRASHTKLPFHAEIHHLLCLHSPPLHPRPQPSYFQRPPHQHSFTIEKDTDLSTTRINR